MPGPSEPAPLAAGPVLRSPRVPAHRRPSSRLAALALLAAGLAPNPVLALPALAVAGLAITVPPALAQLRAAASVRLPVAGHWLTKDQTTVLDIESCGDRVCGRIVAMSKWPRTGVPTDLHGVPECGMTIIRGFRRTGDNLWDGDILDPDTGKDYTAELWLGQEGALHLRGYVGLPLFGLTQVWTRYTSPLPPDCHLQLR